MSRAQLPLARAFLVAVWLYAAGAWAGENVAVDQLPEPVVKAIQLRFPKGELLAAEKETEDGRVKYDVQVRSEGILYEVDVAPEGTILEVDRES